MGGATYNPFAKPIYVMAKPAGPRCNLACEYCYYLEKAGLVPQGQRGGLMDDALLEKFTRDYINAQTTREVLFTWHGGEPLLRDMDFYRKALKLQKKYASGHIIDNSIQTNGTLINEEWCKFFRANGFLVGVSIDGPREFHDRYRLNRAGAPSFDRVMRGIDLLNRHRVQWNAMATVNAANVGHPVEFYRFFKEIDCHYIQFTPVVERFCMAAPHLASPLDGDARLTGFSITPDQWGDFLCGVFDCWWPEDVGRQFIQLFDAVLANWVGRPPGICTLARECGHAAVMEHNGDIYSCDHFVFPEYKLGNILSDSLIEMMYGQRQQAFGRAKSSDLPRRCRECRYLFACHGECPKNRFAVTGDGERGLNYLCGGYYRFFEHSAPAMAEMRSRLASVI